MRFDADDLVVVYDPKAAEHLGSALIEFAELGLTMVAGDPSIYVAEDEVASAVLVNGGMLSGERPWDGRDIKRLADLIQQDESPGIRWVKCPECGHEHYDGYGGVPCGVPGCDCQRIYLPRST